MWCPFLRQRVDCERCHLWDLRGQFCSLLVCVVRLCVGVKEHAP